MEQERKRPLINELTQGKELANQLKDHLDDKTTSTGACEFLVEKILCSYEKAISILNWSAVVAGHRPWPSGLNSRVESPSSLPGTSPGSDNADICYKGPRKRDGASFKKRKTESKWSEQVRVYSEAAVDVPLGDGFSWRKYGQKEILGSNFPRAYYRCTYRHSQGCLATKQVQKCDEDSSVFDVAYKGRHTCIRASHLASVKMQTENPNIEIGPEERQCHEGHIGFGPGPAMETGLGNRPENFPLFSSPLPPTVEPGFENSPVCVSPVYNLQSSDSVLNDIMSATTSVDNSPTVDFGLGFSLGQDDFDTDFLFNVLGSEFFS